MPDEPFPITNPLTAAKSVWTSVKFRTAVYGGIASIVSAFVTGFLASLIPKLGPAQIADLMHWAAGVVGAPFAAAILGGAYVDGQVQGAAGSVATQAAVGKAQEAVTQAQNAAGKAQEAASAAVVAAVPLVQGLPPTGGPK